MTTVKLRAGKYMVPVQMVESGSRIEFSFGYNQVLKDEIKSMEGSKWNPDRKIWTVANSIRNKFQLEYLMGGNPYANYDKPLEDFPPTRNRMRSHQRLMLNHVLTRRTSIIAGEMGTGKTLVAIEALEFLNRNFKKPEVWYIGPKAGVKAVYRELRKWVCKCYVRMMTYENMASVIRNWKLGDPAPQMVIFDECSKIKTASAQRTQAAMHLANSVRDEHKYDGYIMLLSGTPAPKDPVDWWSQCETAQPGFLKYGNSQKMRYDLAKIEQRDTLSGGAYPHLVTWWDDENKCATCGQLKSDPCHALPLGDHAFIKSENKVAKLFAKMEGLVLTVFKKDCIDLPAKEYEEVWIKPTIEQLRKSNMLRNSVGKAITLLGKLRELSDGFQYEKIETDDLIGCSRCHGTGMVTEPDEFGTMAESECPTCEGTGTVNRIISKPNYVGSPKEDKLKEDLDEIEDIGRIVIWGGFTATIDRLTDICVAEGWIVLRVDGRGYKTFGKDAPSSDELLSAMDASDPNRHELHRKWPKVAFVGHPKAGGMALTLTAAALEIYYSNPFDGEARIQSEDRCHRLGMDDRGLIIRDYLCLPSDKVVLDNLKKKRKLQALTLGELNDGWSTAEIHMTRYAKEAESA